MELKQLVEILQYYYTTSRYSAVLLLYSTTSVPAGPLHGTILPPIPLLWTTTLGQDRTQVGRATLKATFENASGRGGGLFPKESPKNAYPPVLSGTAGPKGQCENSRDFPRRQVFFSALRISHSCLDCQNPTNTM